MGLRCVQQLLPVCLLLVAISVFANRLKSEEVSTSDESALDGREILTFENQVRPILREFCLDCHGATENPEGNLDLRLVRFMLSGGDSGPAIVPGNPDESLLIEMVTEGQMPPGQAHLGPEQIEILEAWIREGATTQRPEPESIGPGIPITDQERSYWAYRPLSQVATPTQSTDARIRTGLDAVIASAMPEGLEYSEDADRRTLIRRVYNDILGLPPTPEQVICWMGLPEDRWYEMMVDELLNSIHYGQRWARHWLDAVGYADSDGSTLADTPREWAWRYRDYVIQSLNDDKPFDQFITEQLAGDELAGAAEGDWTPRQIELLTATGFLRMAADGTGSGDNSPEARNKTISDTLQIVGSTLLASSLHCAQCHDHRYDPISHRDYFALRSVFEPALDWQNWKTPNERLVSLTTASERQRQAEIDIEVQAIATERAMKESEFMKQALDKELTKYEEPLKSALRAAYETPSDQRTTEQTQLIDRHPSVNITPGVLYQYLPEAAEELKKYDARMAETSAKKPPYQYVQALVEPAGHSPTTRLFHRGDFNQPTQEVAPGGLAVLASDGARVEFASDDPELPTTGRRLALARWLTARDNPNPLLARALVNRIWMHHFGRGIVSTPGDFGRLGGQPTHPQVLDWLATEWIESGWSLKHLHRLILTSTVFRQSSKLRPEAESLDPENLYYWRKPLLRLDAEVLRDWILTISGDLSPEWGGRPVALQEDDTGQVRLDPAQPRRSIFASWRRTQPVAMLQSFDAPVMNINCDYRPSSTVAPQSLMMMNGEFILDQAAKIGDLSVQMAANDPMDLPSLAVGDAELPAQVAMAWQLILGRPPSAAEWKMVESFATQQFPLLAQDATRLTEGKTVNDQFLTNLCQILLGTNEFLYID